MRGVTTPLRTQRFLPAGKAWRIDTRNELTRNLVACYLPASGSLKNLCGLGNDLAVVAPYNWRRATPDGMALAETAASQGATVQSSAFFKPANSAITLFWRGMAINDESVDQIALIGTRYAANFSTSPFATWIICRGTGGAVDQNSIAMLWNNGSGTFINIGANILWQSNYFKMYSFSASMIPTNVAPLCGQYMTLYSNGKQVAQTSGPTNIPASWVYNSDATLQFNCVTQEPTAIGSVVCTMAGILFREWLPAEHLAWARNPYSFLIPYEIDRTAVLTKKPGAVSAVEFRRTLSSVGTRVGSRQVVHW